MEDSENSTLEVPMIDMEVWLTGSEVERSRILRNVDEALSRIGFLLVTNHGVPAELVDEVRDACAKVFALPSATKERFRQKYGIGGPGWIPVGAEANAYASGEATPPDLKESWAVAPFAEGAMVPTSRGLKPSSNSFPDEVPEFESTVRRYVEAGLAEAGELFELLALAAGQDPEFFRSRCSSPLHTLNLTWYPPVGAGHATVQAEADQYRIGPHCDFGTITLLQREPSDPPLEVQRPDGTWVAIPDVPGAFVVNVGDQLAYWSGGRWRSNPHRILAPDPDAVSDGKLSLVLFLETNVGVMLEPIGNPEAEPMDAVEFLVGKLAAIDTAI